MISGTVITGATVITVAVMSMTRQDQQQVNTTSIGHEVFAEKEDEIQPETVENEEAGFYPITNASLIFQVLMLFVTCYFGMLFTNWGTVTLDEASHEIFNPGSAPMWIKICTQWVTIILYLVSFTLPMCCPDKIL